MSSKKNWKRCDNLFNLFFYVFIYKINRARIPENFSVRLENITIAMFHIFNVKIYIRKVPDCIFLIVYLKSKSDNFSQKDKSRLI